jgi:hypothetical protein
LPTERNGQSVGLGARARRASTCKIRAGLRKPSAFPCNASSPSSTPSSQVKPCTSPRTTAPEINLRRRQDFPGFLKSRCSRCTSCRRTLPALKNIDVMLLMSPTCSRNRNTLLKLFLRRVMLKFGSKTWWFVGRRPSKWPWRSYRAQVFHAGRRQTCSRRTAVRLRQTGRIPCCTAWCCVDLRRGKDGVQRPGLDLAGKLSEVLGCPRMGQAPRTR